MRLHVFFTPAEIITSGAQQDDIYIVIDLIRATTTLAVMFDQGRRASLSRAALPRRGRQNNNFRGGCYVVNAM